MSGIDTDSVMYAAVALVGLFWLLGAAVNLAVAYRRFAGSGMMSGVPVLSSAAGVVLALIVSLWFRWLPLWLTLAVALAPEFARLAGAYALGVSRGRGSTGDGGERDIGEE